MDYPAHVTDTAYRYDGSFQGFLCCVFESFARHELPAAIHPPEEGQTSLFGAREIPTDPRRAGRVAAALHRLGAPVERCVTSGFLARRSRQGPDPAAFSASVFCAGAVRFLADGRRPRWRRPRPWPAACGRRGPASTSNSSALRSTAGMLGSIIHPRNRILPLLRGHFCSRLPDEEFVIFDATHGMALLCRGGLGAVPADGAVRPARPTGRKTPGSGCGSGFFHAPDHRGASQRALPAHPTPPNATGRTCVEMAPEGPGGKKALPIPRRIWYNVRNCGRTFAAGLPCRKAGGGGWYHSTPRCGIMEPFCRIFCAKGSCTMEELLHILEKNGRLPVEDIAAMMGEDPPSRWPP